VSRVRLSRFTVDSHVIIFFAGATHAGQIRVREQIPVTLKTLTYAYTDVKLINNL
jgi:hypothetical protein